MRPFESDNPDVHYPEDLIDVKDKVVLDLGCGCDGNVHLLAYLSTPEYFLSKGAKKIIGVERTQADVDYLQSRITEEQGLFFQQQIDSLAQTRDFILTYKPDVIKCDNEGGEAYLLEMTNEEFNLVEQYYVETHDGSIHNNALAKFAECGYEVIETLDFTPLSGIIQVIFARKIKVNATDKV
jgi:hypothetical protein